MDRISDLPRDILQRILYFVSQEDAVRTSVLSKSWRYTWRIRPNLDFSESTFKGDKREFLSFVDNTLQQYRDQRLCLDEFHLRISLDDYLEYESASLLEEWIPILTTMGVKESRLSICTVDHNDMPSVVFQAESLQQLHVEGFGMDRDAVPTIILSKHLKKLRLRRVHIEGKIFQEILSSCPLIETMHVEKCGGLRNIKANNLRRLKDFSFEGHNDLEDCSIEICPASLETIKINRGKISFDKGAEFRNLVDLDLCVVEWPLLSMFSCEFPSLKRLTLYDCYGLNEESSRWCRFPSLEFLKIFDYCGFEEIQIVIDAPNILYFEYRGNCIPSISLVTNSRDWKSKIYLCECPLSLLKLNELLKSLSQSKIFLMIDNPYLILDNGYNKPVSVESLNLDCGCDLSYFSSFLNDVFCICRPRNIGYCNNDYGGSVMQFVGFMWRILIERESDQLSQLVLQDLEEASMEIKEWYEEEWHRAPLSEFLINHVRCEGPKCQSRFTLKWRETS
ncbi:hypothetical protein ABFS82_05G051700 [Erythranthe guttata]|uniref:F-box domain-containing protein n=1 Tax=Erythranthe guttata TaxID=4155 RepID=A0A022QRI8_ERYGU|nr:PREDICTED: putative F-box/LRR-repeat protein At4g15060 [Erythranthe guttata]EYU30204.1 hypothetical protein MIMGU_mgv1a022845mg [Erythranthe guttata]|eukprot:XP_012845994.1 PREDICTED: putative F-box/LRR-repeat protein At4g15060 [Erythranthe guttata]